MHFLHLIILIITLLSQLSFTQGNLGKCNEDWECGVGYYCSSKFCEACVPCEDVFYRQTPRHKSGEPICAKSVANCGECLKRFQIYDESDQKCYPSKEPISSFTTSAAPPSAWAMFFLGFLGWIIN